MGWILRTSNDMSNPTLAGGVYGPFITIGKAVYWRFDGTQTRGIILIADGGQYGLWKVSDFSYNGASLTEDTEWIFHPGTLPAQNVPVECTVNTGTEELEANDFDVLADDDLVRFGVIDGVLPIGLNREDKFMVKNVTKTTLEVYDETGTTQVTFSNTGTGTLLIWKADTGFDDPVQGLPTFCPEVDTTFPGIAYIEFKLPAGVSSSDPPDWQNFRTVGIGRRLMEYDNTGTALGLITDDDLHANIPLAIADNALVNAKMASDRIDWDSWADFYAASTVNILQRVRTDETVTTHGLTAQYYTDDNFTTLGLSRIDSNIAIADTLPTTPPAPGISGYGFSVIWRGQIKPEFSETYTLKFIHDNEVKVWLDGQVILDQTSVGTHTVELEMVADQLYTIEVHFRQLNVVNIANHYQCEFKWSSASQTEEMVPNDRLYPADEIVPRYAFGTAFPTATEAGEVHERLMERAPGWDWTDDEGLIKFLGPDRPVVFAFSFDRTDDDNIANFVAQDFARTRRALSERDNFLLGQFRNILLTGYPFQFVQADRPNLRRFTGGEPTNKPAIELGVVSPSLAERTLENELVLKSDPKFVYRITGGGSSSGIRKNQLVTVTYYDENNVLVTNEQVMITSVQWGDPTGRIVFAGIPLPPGFYVDEPAS